MPRDLKLFVVDTGPLITLAAAQSLDYLLFVDADVVIPDAVLYEATHDASRLGRRTSLTGPRCAAPRSRLLRPKLTRPSTPRGRPYLTFANPTSGSVLQLK